MLRLDYLSCVLTVVATVLIGRKNWGGLVIAGVNSLVVCVIGIKTSQLGFIPANVFCIVVYAMNLRSWRKEEDSKEDSTKKTVERPTTTKLIVGRG